MRRLLRSGYVTGAVLLSLLVAVINGRLYRPGGGSDDAQCVASDVLPQLRFLREALREGAGERIQALFPEGYFFSHTLYGLAWAEVGSRQGVGDSARAEALAEARWALDRLDSAQGRAPFAERLDPPYGVFYVGWTAWLRGGILRLQPADRRDADEVARFAADCGALAEAFDRSGTPFLCAYPGQAWPVDSVVAVAALRLHDTLLAPRYGTTVARWLGLAQERVDPATGVLPHTADPVTGATIEGARGSSQSLTVRFLPEVEAEWGREQYALFREQFAGALLGLPGVREYPQGVEGPGDVDSGPLIGGVSASATVVGIGAARVNGDARFAGQLCQVVEAFGVPLRWRGAKRYNLGQLPVGDAFLAWAKASRPWVASPTPAPLPAAVGWWWRWPVHGVSLVVLSAAWLPAWLACRRRRRGSAGDA